MVNPLAVVSLLVAGLAVLIPMGVHRIEEGHVGVYWRGGALLPPSSITHPGYHWKLPITTVRSIQVTMQTDQVKNIPCGTSGGVMLYFDKIEVVNQLRPNLVHATIQNYTVEYDKTWIYDKIHHEINQFCSAHTLQEVYIDMFDRLDESLVQSLQTSCNVWAPGIQIVAIRVTKPRIPETIRLNYEEMEAEKTKLLIADQKQKVVEKEAQTDRRRAVIEASKVLDVAKITMEKTIAEQEAQYTIAAIDNEVVLAREKAFADAAYYSAERETQSNNELLTSAFLEARRTKAMLANAQLVVGDKVPQSLYFPGLSNPHSGGVSPRLPAQQ